MITDMNSLPNQNIPRILVIADAGFGKDSTGVILNTLGFRCAFSSLYATEKVMIPYFRSVGKFYDSVEECHADRVNHRKVWFEQIEAYNTPDWARMSKEVLADGYTVYVGMRSLSEFEASKHLFDHIVWVDASQRLPPEDRSSNKLTCEHADFIIDNNGHLEDLCPNVETFVRSVLS